MGPRTALVLYGSETGNAQEIAEEIGRITERLRFSTRVCEFDSVGLKDILEHSEAFHLLPNNVNAVIPTALRIVLCAISTTGQGEFPGNARLFWRKLRNARLKPGCLAQVRFVSFGLGDSSYPQFNWAHRKLYNRLRFLGAVPFNERGESDEQHPEGIEGCFIPWAATLKQSLLDLCPLPDGLSALSDEEFLEPKWSFYVEENLGNGFTKPSSSTSNGVNRTNGASSINGLSDVNKLPSGEPDSGHTTTSVTAQDTMKGRTMIPITLTAKTRLTPDSHWQDVRLFDFTTEPLQYEAGDVLTIFPKNDRSDVDLIIILMGWQSVADLPADFKPTHSGEEGEYYPPYPGPVGLITLRQLLTDQLDINAIPRRSFFTQIAHFTTDEMQRERLLEFTKPEYVDELYDYTTRPRRSIIEVLQEFDTVEIPLRWVASVFPCIRGRQFSIASGGDLKITGSGDGRIQLLVAIVKYKTVIKKIREGLCTKYLARLQPGQHLQALFCKGGLKHDSTRPAVMIGPGTGLAPLRAMIYDRAATIPSPSASAMAENLLFFGGRNKSADYFFEDEWPALERSVGLQVNTAFSRDQKAKIYVQDVIREQAHVVYKVLKEGSIYICGSSGKMPQAVREALIEVIQQQGHETREHAESWLVDMETSGRYQQETW